MTKNSSLIVPDSVKALEVMKYEIAKEFGLTLGAEATARENGSVGGEITKRLVQLAQQQYI
ncbi:small, acid-soluble spore protein, alpha/beta type [Priestia megaterium]|nr:small, acid-soluble spore protein, alpha/beta type [Priestia megaterium]